MTTSVIPVSLSFFAGWTDAEHNFLRLRRNERKDGALTELQCLSRGHRCDGGRRCGTERKSSAARDEVEEKEVLGEI